jgi:hypothetical protein
MTTTIGWEGRNIELRIYFTPRLAMLATDATVTVDGWRVARKGGWGLSETAVGSFNHNGREIRTELRVGGRLGVFTRIPYVLRLDGSPISEGTLDLERVAPAAAVWLSVAGLLVLLALAI